jgi:topoisomerase-4 subunit A
MSDETKDIIDPNTSEKANADAASGYTPVNRFDASAVHHLSGMYQNWFLDYASYVILERAVPNIEDGLKPVQRRILHSMKRMDDGRFNKVANIVGHTMQFHPHGDASIGDALVQMGQKNLLIDTQGNWGNILTGDRSAAPRYIEARLTKFALDVVFNPKTTKWQMSYDGRNKEPITLPAKFPLLLAQGAEGIAVGLTSKILPHNFNELCDAAIKYLRGEKFVLYPDFPTGGSIDVEKYNGGERGGSIKVRAKIEKVDNKTLVIKEIPFSKTTSSLIDSILRAIEKGKIKAKRVDDNTAAEVEILVHLSPGVSSDKAIDALYAFSDCEISISPNCCVIEDDKPCFLTVEDVLRHSTDNTLALLKRELEIRRNELMEQLFFASLERIFIEERIYKERRFEQAPDLDTAIAFVDEKLTPFKPTFVREVTRDDILRLLEIRMQRILKFNKDKAEELIAKIKAEIKEIDHDLKHMKKVTINWFEYLKKKYGAEHPRKTEIRNFETIEAAKVIEANEKLYIDRKEGFIGTGLKKHEFVCNCSDIDDIIVFYKDGKYKIVKVADKLFVGKKILHVQVFEKNDRRTIYNVIYRHGRQGYYYAKRFNVTSITRDREYDVTKNAPGSKIVYFTANPNGEAELLRITLEPNPKLRKIFIDFDFSSIDIKDRGVKGKMITKLPIQRISVKRQGLSTLGGRKVWYDPDVNRINYDGNGRLLGEFKDDDLILVVLDNGDYYFTDFDVNNHYDDNIFRIEKFDPEKVWTAAVIDANNNNMPYLKRFLLESARKTQNVMGENPKNQLLLLTDQVYPRILVTFGGEDNFRDPMEIDAEEFVTVKGFKAKGKRISTWNVASVEELEPTRFPEEKEEENEKEENEEEDKENNTKETTAEDDKENENGSEEDGGESNTVKFKISDDGQMELF